VKSVNKLIKFGLGVSLCLVFSAAAFGQNDDAKVSIPKPIYPAKAKAAGIIGSVKVRIKVDSTGKVIKATAFRGPKALWKAAEQAALKATMPIRTFDEQEKGIKTVINYTFDEKTPTK
jgi:TonB family protein